LKDLQRFLRKDDPDTREVFFKLGAFDTARKDLVPLLIHYPQDHDIVYNAREWYCSHICLYAAYCTAPAQLSLCSHHQKTT